MKIALCFIINYEHVLHKEEIWKEWIEQNKDIINVYFYYKELKKIKSKWIMKHTIPPNYIQETSYYHVIPAYISIMRFALTNDSTNQWFCMLTDSCCPIISPKKFRHLFYTHYQNSIINWKKAWWNINLHKRANLNKLPKEFHLGNDPWFVIKRENVLHTLHFINRKQEITKTICSGGLANESLFAVILCYYKQLLQNGPVISESTHITDWNRMKTSTSPHVFTEGNETDLKFIDVELDKNKYAMFIRKVSPEFPNDILRYYIYEKNKITEEKLSLREPLHFIFNRILKYSLFLFKYGFIILLFYKFTYMV